MHGRLSWERDGRDWPNREASRFVPAAGIVWHVQVMGEGPVLLLAHGTGAATHSWRGLAPLLAQRFTVVAPDLPGHGFTSSPAPRRLSLPGMAESLRALCLALGVTPALALGHSAGAAILIRMALDGGIAPAGIVSVNGALLPFRGLNGVTFQPMAQLLVSCPLVPRLFAWRAGDPATVARLLAGTGSTIDAFGLRLYGRLAESPAHVAAALGMMAAWDLKPLERELPRLDPHLLLLAAVRDRMIRPEDARRVRARLQAAELMPLDGLGHLAHEEQPALVAGIVADLAERLGVLTPPKKARAAGQGRRREAR